MPDDCQSCDQCQHVGRHPSTANRRPIMLHECRHPTVFGLMACESCKRWSLFELFTPETIAGRVVVRCPKDGCRHRQSIPADDDWRIGFVGFVEIDSGEPVAAPNWCPGFEPKQPDEPEPTAKPKRLTKRQKRELEPSLF